MDLRSYIGIPFKDKGRDRSGLDCWGLLRLIYRDQLKIALPSYTFAYDKTDPGCGVGHLIEKNISHEWVPVPAGEEKPGDGILLRIQGEPMHVAVVVGRGEMIHVMKGLDVTVEKYRSNTWKHRVMGFYRHRMSCQML